MVRALVPSSARTPRQKTEEHSFHPRLLRVRAVPMSMLDHKKDGVPGRSREIPVSQAQCVFSSLSLSLSSLLFPHARGLCSLSLGVSLSLCLSVYLSVSLALCICLSLCLCLSVCHCVCLCLCVHMCVCMCLSLSLCASLSLYFSVSLFTTRH